MSRAYWLLEIDRPHGTLRLAVEPLEVDTAAGDTLVFDGGLVEAPDSLAVGDDAVPVMVQLPAEVMVDPVALELSPVRLFRWVGGLYETAVLFAEGRARSVEYAAPEEPIMFSIIADVEGDAPMPDPSAVVEDGVTWPLDGAGGGTVVPEEHVGIPYPVIYGFPGWYSSQGSEKVAEVVPMGLGQLRPAGLSETYVVVAHEPLLPGTVDNHYHLMNRTGPVLESYIEEWQIIRDNLGRSITVSDFTSAHSHYPNDPEEAGQWYGGFAPDGGGGIYRDAYAVICDVLRKWSTSVRVDWSAMARSEAILSRYNVDTWINAPTKCWKWLNDTLLPYLPVVVTQGPRGRHITPMPTWATDADVRLELDADRGDCDRRSPVSVDSAELVNEITARYWRLPTGSYLASRTFTAQDGILGGNYLFIGGDDRVFAHPLAAQSQSRFGIRPGAPLDVDWTWDPATVLRVMEDRLNVQAFPLVRVRYYVHGGELQQGDVVKITDSEIGLTNRLGIVQEAPLQEPEGQVVRLRVVPVV